MLLPSDLTLAQLALHVLGTALVMIPVISLVEYVLHRHVMHRQRLPKLAYKLLPGLYTQFHDHAVLHHGTYYKEFDYEPNAVGRTHNICINLVNTLRISLVLSPLIVPLALFVSLASALTVVGMTLLHNRLWSLVHMQMHVPDPRSWIAKTRYFKAIAIHHFMHHERSAKNYNVVVPLADFVLGRATSPAPSHVRELLRLGYIAPRHAATSARLADWRTRVSERRTAAERAAQVLGATDAPAAVGLTGLDLPLVAE
jgi:hypothetical protein